MDCRGEAAKGGEGGKKGEIAYRNPKRVVYVPVSGSGSWYYSSSALALSSVSAEGRGTGCLVLLVICRRNLGVSVIS